jgi:HD-GYP domain-containing protein (c-di-GMP phosphodiesterase class II)
VRKRRGADLDPEVSDAFLRAADDLLATIETDSVWDAALAAEPEPHRTLAGARLDDVAHAFAGFADLKSPYVIGHSSAVGRLADAAARTVGLSDDEVATCRRAGLLHDLGRVSVPNSIWDKAGRLTAAEWERVRLHPYYTERILTQSPVLRPLAHLAGSHHERRDGSGYHRGTIGGARRPAPASSLPPTPTRR